MLKPQEILKLTLGRVDMVLVLLQVLVLSRHVVLHNLLLDSCFTSCSSLEIGVKPAVGTPAKALLRLGIPEVAGVPRGLDVELGAVGPLALHRLGLADLRAAHAGFFELVIFMHNLSYEKSVRVTHLLSIPQHKFSLHDRENLQCRKHKGKQQGNEDPKHFLHEKGCLCCRSCNTMCNCNTFFFPYNFVNEILFHFVHRQSKLVLRLQLSNVKMSGSGRL